MEPERLKWRSLQKGIKIGFLMTLDPLIFCSCSTERWLHKTQKSTVSFHQNHMETTFWEVDVDHLELTKFTPALQRTMKQLPVALIKVLISMLITYEQ